MSRIAGVMNPGGRPAGLAREMSSALAPFPLPFPSWTAEVECEGEAAFAYVGAENDIARLGRCLAVVDGTFCNVAELPQARSNALRLLLLHERHGFEGALAKICGEFAAALYDEATGTLWLGRDRVGARPCYYARFSGGVGFASRPAALLGLPGVPQQIDRRFASLFAASHYRTFDTAPNGSPYAAIAQLPAGHLARIHNGEIAVRRWWTLPDAPDWTGSEDEWAEQYRSLLFTAVHERLRQAKAPAFTLSGGLDSSSVLSCAVQLTGQRRQAFSSVYEDSTFDESDEIKTMLQANVERWHPVRIGQVDVFSIVEEMVAAHDEPVATATWLSHWLLCRQASREGFLSLFGGLGGDELNAGEYEYFFFHFADLRKAGREDLLRHEIAQWARHHDHPIWKKNHQTAEEAMARLTDQRTPGLCLPDRKRITRYAAALRPGNFDLAGFAPPMESPFSSYLKNRTWQDIFSEAAPCCLRAEDRQTRAFGMVNVDPFYDHRLLEFMFRVPGSGKIRDGITKHLLRKAMKGVLPEETRTRIKKTGWNAPAHIWFSGAQADAVRDMVRSSGFLAAEFYDTAEVLRLLDEHCAIVESRAAAENHMMFFWQLVNMETWLRLHAARRAPAKADANADAAQ